MRTKILFLALCSTALSGCAFYVSGAIPAGARQLTFAELESLISRTEKESLVFDDGYDDGLRYRFRGQGKLEVKSRFISKIVNGTYRLDIATGNLCTRIETDPENCSAVFQVSENMYYRNVDGMSQQANTFVVRDAK